MSGGHWDFQDQRNINPEVTKLILQAVKDTFHDVDYALSGDISKSDAKERIFQRFENLGDALFK